MNNVQKFSTTLFALLILLVLVITVEAGKPDKPDKPSGGAPHGYANRLTHS
jgi:hypothetical protein